MPTIGNWKYTNSGSWSGNLEDHYILNTGFYIRNKASNYEVTIGDTNGLVVITNTGSTGEVIFTIPNAIPGNSIIFINTTGNSMVLTAQTDEKIYTSSETSGANSVSNSLKGNMIKLFCIDEYNWYSIDKGTWSS